MGVVRSKLKILDVSILPVPLRHRSVSRVHCHPAEEKECQGQQTRRRISTRMLHTFLLLHTKGPYFKQVCSILTQSFILPTNHRFSTQTSLVNSKTPPYSNTNQTHEDLFSLKFSSIVKNVISKCSNISDTHKALNFTNLSLEDYFLILSNTSPETIRRFWRVSVLNPQDVLEILLGFESDSRKYEIDNKKVESLWGIFKWASEQTRDFRHFPRSCRIMASMLVQVGLFRECEYLLSRRESREILLDCQEIFSNLIEGYVGEFELDRAVGIYKRMRGLSLVPSVSSYLALVKYLVELNEIDLMYHVYVDMMKMGMGVSVQEKEIHEKLVKLLCIDGKVQEARDLVKKVKNFGIEPSNIVVNAIGSGYCEKKDYDDLLSFFTELRIVPNAIVGNKILFSSCRNFGVEKASMFLQELQELCFCPDEISFGILIGSSCREGKLKDAFIYVSEIALRGLKPHLYSYNALLSGIFKAGLWKHSRDILVEMNDMGVAPSFSTYRVLLAGFCKARQFDDAKAVIIQMEDRELVKLSSSEDPLTKAFMLLGLDPLSVKIKRDNDKECSNTEFYDNLGNGLYLDTNLDEYEKKIDEVLDEAMIPDFNSSILENFHSLDVKNILTIVDEMSKWGQEISLPTLSSLVSCLCVAPCSINTINHVFEVFSKSAYHLDKKGSNMLIRAYCLKGLTFRARTTFDGMIQRSCIVENNTYSALLINLCKKCDLKSFYYCYKLARKSNWSPEVKDGKALLGYLCKNKWLNEAFELLETTLFVRPYNALDIFHYFFEELCGQGLTSTASILLEEFSKREIVIDNMAYSHLISGFFHEKMYTKTLVFLDTMLSKSLHPPIDVSIKLIPKLCMTKNFEKAFALRDVYLKEQPSILFAAECALIDGFCNSGMVEEAVNIFQEILLTGLVPNDEVFNSLIQGYSRGKNFKKIKEFLGFMVRKNLSISISSYSNMVSLICKEGKFFLAHRLKELMLQVNSFPELVLYNILIFHISKTQNSFLVNTAIDELQNKGMQFDEVTYNYIIQGFLRCKNMTRSHYYLMSMVSQDLRPSNRTLLQVTSFLCSNGELEKALNLSRDMELRGWIHSSVVQTNIVEALLINGKLNEAVDFLHRMEKKDLVPNNIKYDYLIKQFYFYNRLDKAVDLLNIMLRKGSEPESTSYDYVIRGLCNCGKLNLALDFHTEMLYKELKPCLITWEILVRGLVEVGRVFEAEKLLISMTGLGETPSKEMFGCVINSYRSGNDFGKASEVLKLMQEKGGYVPDFETHWSLISNLTNSCKRDESNQNRSFLSGLLSGFGFSRKNSNSKVG